MSQLFLSHHPQYAPLSEVIALCRKYSTGIELSTFASLEKINDPAQIETHSEVVSSKLPRSIHGPYLGLYPGQPDPDMRMQVLGCFRQVYHIAAALDSSHLIFHHNFDPQACSKSDWLIFSTLFWKNYLAECPGIRVHLENVMDDTPDLISALVDAVNSPFFDIALDIGHVYCYSRVPSIRWTEQLGCRIGYVHLHDNHGHDDEHLGLGQGNIDLPEVLDSLKRQAPNAIWSLESGGDRLYQSIEWLVKHAYIE